MTVLDVERQIQQQPEGYAAVVRVEVTSWGGTVQPSERSTGAPPGYGARLAVRKFGRALNKLADS